MKRLSVLMVFTCIMFGHAALADNAVISWDAPTTREDGSALDPDTELSHYGVIVDGRDEYIVPASEQTLTIQAILPGQHSAIVYAVDTDGRDGLFSDTIPFGVKGRAGVPTNITITIVPGGSK